MEKDRIIADIRAASREIVRQVEFLHDTFASVNSTSEWHALVEIETHKRMNMGQLAERLNIKNFTISRITAKFIAKGLCQTELDESDRRNKLISLTKKGQLYVEKVHKEINAEVEYFLGMINQEEVALVLQGLTIYAQALKQARYKKQMIKKRTG